MLPGDVVKIRVRPIDVLGCIDVCRAAGYHPPPGTSIAQIVKTALTILLGAAHAANSIPERSGFEYATMVDPYKRASPGKKVQIGHMLRIADLAAAGRDMDPVAVRLGNGMPELLDPSVIKGSIPAGGSPTAAHAAHSPAAAASRESPGPDDVKRGRDLREWNALDIRAEHDPANMMPDDWERYRALSRELNLPSHSPSDGD